MLDTEDTLLSPNVSHPSNANASLSAIRRNIYRKQFNAEALRLIYPTKAPARSFDELVHSVHLACASSGLILV